MRILDANFTFFIFTRTNTEYAMSIKSFSAALLALALAILAASTAAGNMRFAALPDDFSVVAAKGGETPPTEECGYGGCRRRS